MRKLAWSLQAATDLQIIYRFYYNQNPDAANKIYQRIKAETVRLIKFPYIASVEPLLEKEPETYRSLIVLQNFKVIYTVENNSIYIAHVWDCRQNPQLLQERYNKE